MAKTKVQAQRKFAQGAYVPTQPAPAPSTTNTHEVKREKTEKKDIICNKTSAKNLLDIVSFQRHHKHAQLIVVVERLENMNAFASVAKKQHTLKSDKTLEKKEENKEIEKIKKRKCVIKTRPSLSMRLRSQAPAKRVKNPTKKKGTSLKRQIAPEIETSSEKSKIKRKRLIKSSVSELSDDSIPLSHIKTQTRQVHSCQQYGKTRSKRIVKRDGLRNSFKKSIEHKATSNTVEEIAQKAQVEGNKESMDATRKIEIDSYAPDCTVSNKAEEQTSGDNNMSLIPDVPSDVITTLREESEEEDELEPLVWSETNSAKSMAIFQIEGVPTDGLIDSITAFDEIEKSQVPITLKNFSINDMTVSNLNLICDELEKDSPRCESPKEQPQSAVESQETAASPTQSPIVPQSLNQPAKPLGAKSVIATPLISSDINEPQPGTSGLNPANAGPCITISSSNSDVDEPHQSDKRLPLNDKGPYYNELEIQRWLKRGMPTQPAPITPAACPANAWVTLKDVVHALKEDIAKRCNKCRQCVRVSKLFKLSSLLKKQRTIECQDEQFDYHLEHTKSEPRDENNIVSSGSDNNHHLYLELLPSHPHLMIKLKIQDVNQKQILSARLIPRSDAKMSEELLLAEDENLVDEFTNMLMFSVEERSSSGIGILSNTVPVRNPGALSNSEQLIRQGNSNLPRSVEQMDAPVFRPSKEEFNDPIAYFEMIAPSASKFGLCKVVPPEFTPKCNLNDEIRFDATNQYISRLYSRWGPAARELCAIKTCVNSNSVQLTRAPLLEGIEMNLTKLYHVVQKNGGLEKVMGDSRWRRVAEDMGLARAANHERKLQMIYMKYILPYDSLAQKGRQAVIRKVETLWNRRNRKMLDRALNPLHRQKRLLGESESSGEETEDETVVSKALSEAEDCIVSGSCMNLTKFKRIAATALENHFRTAPTSPTTAELEKEYWSKVLQGTEHICVNTASIDTGEEAYGFSIKKEDPYSEHPWNLKMLSHNSGNILGTLGPVLGLTVPTLHLGMVFSTSCWHRDPHALPWIEYMHEGPNKIWYGVPDEQSDKFRRAVENLCPTSCQNKSIWLPSDITMIPPNLLLEHKVSLSRVEQKPGEFIIVFPKAYSCSISTGYTVSESVYFATNSWLNSVDQVFQEVRESCEPTMFSLEQLLMAVGTDRRTSLAVLQQVLANLGGLVNDELDYRERLRERGLPIVHVTDREHINKNKKRRTTGAWNIDECDICRMTLYLSKVSELPDQETSYCLQHTLRLLDVKKENNETMGDLQVTVYLTTEKLLSIMNQVQGRLTQPTNST